MQKAVMTMIQNLVVRLPPPSAPIETDSREAIGPIEVELGLHFPGDYVGFATKYGSGRIGSSLKVYNPFSKQDRLIIGRVANIFRKLKRDEGDEFVPYNIYPESPGLFPWGEEVNGTSMFWLTKGNPDKWPIIVFAQGGKIERFDMSVSEFLSRLLNGELDSKIWRKEWLKENYKAVKFEPGS
jgi:hypothetical protein